MEENVIRIVPYLLDAIPIISVIISIGSTIVYKIEPYLKTKIRVHQYLNVKVYLWLINYEIDASLLFIWISAMITAMVGQTSSWNYISKKEFISIAIILTLIYLVGILIIIWKKRESSKCKYFNNVLGGLLFHFLCYLTFIDSYFENNTLNTDTVVFLGILLIWSLQGVYIIDREKIRDLKYIIHVSGKKKYKTEIEPVKHADFYVIKMKQEIIEIPVSDVKKIKIEIKDRKSSDIKTNNIETVL